MNVQWSHADANSVVFTWAQAFWFLLISPNALAWVLLQILLCLSTDNSDFYPDVLRKICVCV